MATRLYFGSNSEYSELTPAVPTAWEAGTDKSWSRGYLRGQSVASFHSASEALATNPADAMAARFFLPALQAQTISGTFSLAIGCQENDIFANASLQVMIRVYNQDMTVERGVLYAGHSAANNTTPGALGQEMWQGAYRTRIINGETLTPVVAQDGDVLCVELGARFANASTSTYNAWFLGSSSSAPSDLPLAAGTTDLASDGSSGHPWIEFSGDIAFNVTPIGAGSGGIRSGQAFGTATIELVDKYLQASGVAPPGVDDELAALGFQQNADGLIDQWYTTSMQLSADPSETYAGHASIKMTSPSLGSHWMGNESAPVLTPGSKQLSIAMKGETAGERIFIEIYTDGWNGYSTYEFELDTEWREFTGSLDIGGAGDITGIYLFRRSDLGLVAGTSVWFTQVLIGPPSGNLFGAPEVSDPANPKLWASGIATAETFGSTSVVPDQALAPSAVATGEAFGGHVAYVIPNQDLLPSGLSAPTVHMVDNVDYAEDFSNGLGDFSEIYDPLNDSAVIAEAGTMKVSLGTVAQAGFNGESMVMAPGTKRVRFLARASEGVTVTLGVYSPSTQDLIVEQDFDVTTAWAEHHVDFSTAETGIGTLFFQASGPGVDLWIDDLELGDQGLTVDALGTAGLDTSVGLSATGIASGEALGSGTLLVDPRLTLVGMPAPLTALGEPTVLRVEHVELAGIPSAEAFGGPITLTQEIFLASTPSIPQKPAAPQKPFDRVNLKHGLTVYVLDGVYTQTRYPVEGSLDAYDAVYYGGREYEVSASLATQLEAQGFTIRTETR